MIDAAIAPVGELGTAFANKGCKRLCKLVGMMISTASPTDFDTLRKASASTGSAVKAHGRALLSALLIVASLPAAGAGLYLVKSALGINIMPGHSPLHDLLYHLVR
jgi:hypothetical protein